MLGMESVCGKWMSRGAVSILPTRRLDAGEMPSAEEREGARVRASAVKIRLAPSFSRLFLRARSTTTATRGGQGPVVPPPPTLLLLWTPMAGSEEGRTRRCEGGAGAGGLGIDLGRGLPTHHENAAGRRETSSSAERPRLSRAFTVFRPTRTQQASSTICAGRAPPPPLGNRSAWAWTFVTRWRGLRAATDQQQRTAAAF